MSNPTFNNDIPLVYACSGCSDVAQVCHDIAHSLNKSGLAEMACIAAIGANVQAQVDVAQSGRHIIALDACRTQCVKHSLKRHGIEPDKHLVLSQLGREHLSLRDSIKLLQQVYDELGFAPPADV